MALDAEILRIGGHLIRLTHPDSVVYPETGTTKADVASYYRAVAPLLVPLAHDRPATRKQWMTGVGTEASPSDSFFHKNLDRGAPRWISRRSIRHADHTNRYPLLNDEATLIWFVQRGTLEFHVPQWRFGTGRSQRNPDRVVFDLDPGPGTGLTECTQVALAIREELLRSGLNPWPVTSGSKGIHIYADVDGSRSGEQLVQFARDVATELEARQPKLIIGNMRRERREGRILIDWSQNHAARTTVAPYSLRGRPWPMVAFPRDWAELEATAPLGQVSLSDARERLTDLA